MARTNLGGLLLASKIHALFGFPLELYSIKYSCLFLLEA